MSKREKKTEKRTQHGNDICTKPIKKTNPKPKNTTTKTTETRQNIQKNVNTQKHKQKKHANTQKHTKKTQARQTKKRIKLIHHRGAGVRDKHTKTKKCRSLPPFGTGRSSRRKWRLPKTTSPSLPSPPCLCSSAMPCRLATGSRDQQSPLHPQREPGTPSERKTKPIPW